METTTTPTTFAEAELRLAEALPGYESRPQQQALALAIEKALEEGTHLIAQAGCGTGKSLGYMIPAILSGKRTMIATATKALQDQVADKDLPFLQEHLGVPFTSAILKGRSNYLCIAETMGDNVGDVPTIVNIRKRTEEILELQATVGLEAPMGERDDFEVPDNRDWMKVTVSSEDCPGASECPYGKQCFAQRAKAIAQEAQIVVANHALLFTDLMVKDMTDGAASMLGEFDVVVFDEAHEAEEYASSVLGTSFSEGAIRALATQVRNFATQAEGRESAAVDAASNLVSATQVLWGVLKAGERVRANTVNEHESAWENFAVALKGLMDAVGAVSLENVSEAKFKSINRRKKTLHKRARNLFLRSVDIITAAANPTGGNFVSWVEEETTRKGEKRKVIKSAPIDVSDVLRRWLFEQYPTILVSATILVNGSADYIAGRLGVDTYDHLDVGTPFDFSTQARLFIPRDIPEPTKEAEAWQQVSIEIMGDLVKASNGRALLLFTSVKQMRRAYDSLKTRLPFECKVQGEMPNRDLGEWFKSHTNSVLFATRSFMTGFDVQGESLSLVVVDKLPFPVPTDPIVEARCDAIVAAGGSDFGDYTIPVMSLVLQQAHGRLIRHRNDRGVVAILDPRLKTKNYGKTIMRSLPSSPEVNSPQEVADFLR